MKACFGSYMLVVIAMALVALGPCSPSDADDPAILYLRNAVDMALARDVLVREAQLSLQNARLMLLRSRAMTPTLITSADYSFSSSEGLDPNAAVTGTEYSSQSYSAYIHVPLPADTLFGLSTSAYTSTTNSLLRTGGGAEFSYAGASVRASLSRPLGVFRDERVLAEADRLSAELGVREAELIREEANRQVVADALGLFFAALRAQRREELVAASRTEADELLRVSQARLERGRLAEIDVMEAEVVAASAAVSQRQAESVAATAGDYLKDFLGLPLEQHLRLAHEAACTEADPLDEEELLARALAQRAGVEQMTLAVEAAALSVRQAQAASRPGVYLTGGYARSGEAYTVSRSFSNLANPNWYVGLSCTSSLSGKEDRAAIEEARGNLRLAEANAQLHRGQVRLEIRRLVRAVRDAADNAAILADTVRLAEENLGIRRVQFEHGLIPPLDVIRTERQLANTQSEHLDAVIEEQLARARLMLEVGEMPDLGGTRS